jgi:hypothetical protein
MARGYNAPCTDGMGYGAVFELTLSGAADPKGLTAHLPFCYQCGMPSSKSAASVAHAFAKAINGRSIEDLSELMTDADRDRQLAGIAPQDGYCPIGRASAVRARQERRVGLWSRLAADEFQRLRVVSGFKHRRGTRLGYPSP